MVRKPKPAAPAPAPLRPPPGGAVVRMYRIGHGDCFLIAFDGAPGKPAQRPSYVLIDCGFKPGSPDKLAAPTQVAAIGADILAVTGGFIDVAVITHEHQDHVNGFTPANFPGLKVGEVWYAWTENPGDEVAEILRKKYKDRLLGLIDRRNALLGVGNQRAFDMLDGLLSLELGEDAGDYNGRTHAAANGKDPAKSANKLAMQFLRSCSRSGDAEFLYPHGAPRPVPGAAGARAFVLGPPRDVDKIDDLDPVGSENFGDDPDAHAFAIGSGGSGARAVPLFPRRHIIPLADAFGDDPAGVFFRARYGHPGAAVPEAADDAEIPSNPLWRQLTGDDGSDAGALALAMNNATNNASLVLAFELGRGGKVLLFAADAQAGNWRSWADDTFDDGGRKVTAKELLGRTVLYKVGHHGSHNATLNGDVRSPTPNLSWLGRDRYGEEFVAMITAVEKWAHQKPKPDWNHPLPAIKAALKVKATGRVLQTDTEISQSEEARGPGEAGWQSFEARVSGTPLYFDLTIEG